MSASEPSRLWILNLDGEHELESGLRYQPTDVMIANVERARPALWTGPDALARPGDLVLADPASAPHRLRGHEPIACLRITTQGAQPEAVERGALEHIATTAWMPTARAHAIAAEIGTQLSLTNLTDQAPAAPTQLAQPVTQHASRLHLPDLPALTLANARDFTAALHARLTTEESQVFLAGDEPTRAHAKTIAPTLDIALELLARPAPLGWLVRRRFGAAGRGRRKLYGAPLNSIQTTATHLSAADLTWLEASLRIGPLVIERFVEIQTEYTRSGFVTESGDVLLSEPCFQATNATGAWTRTERPMETSDIARADDQALSLALERAGRELAAIGYVGPFGIDAFRYSDPDRPGHTRLNPLSEINARLTMDWRLAMGDKVRDSLR
jgi:hypothetical protein